MEVIDELEEEAGISIILVSTREFYSVTSKTNKNYILIS